MKACTVAALSVMFFAEAQAWLTVSTYSAAGCGAGDLMKSEYQGPSCTPTGCSFGMCYQKVTCNTTHMIQTWYSDDSCTAVHATQNNGMPSVWDANMCSLTDNHGGNVEWRMMTCLDSAPSATSSLEIWIDNPECTGNASMTWGFVWQDCERRGEYENGQWVLKSEGKAMEGASMVMKEYDTIDCSGTPTKTSTLVCGQCNDMDGHGVIGDCSSLLVDSALRSSPKTILAVAAAVLVGAARFQ